MAPGVTRSKTDIGEERRGEERREFLAGAVAEPGPDMREALGSVPTLPKNEIGAR
jgi:hypothetical protein